MYCIKNLPSKIYLSLNFYTNVFLCECKFRGRCCTFSNRHCSHKKSCFSFTRIIASIPLIFAVQQFTEGFLWLSLTSPRFAGLQSVATIVFLFFAQVVWPVWVPYAILKLEPKENR